MRSCIYCGRELNQGEVCNCPQAVARRNSKQGSDTSNQSTAYNQNKQNTYHTGYTAKQSRAKHSWEKQKPKAQARKNAYKARKATMPKGFWSNLWRFIARFVISPVETIANPGYISQGAAMVVSGISGAIISLCLCLMLVGVARTPYNLLASAMSFGPILLYQRMMYMGISLVSGFIGGIIVFVIFAGILCLINRFIFRRRTAFWDFAPRFSLTLIPIALMSIVGILFGMFSSTTLAILVICGFIGSVVLTYESLKTEWISYPPGKVMYSMMLGYFAFTAIICYLIRILIFR